MPTKSGNRWLQIVPCCSIVNFVPRVAKTTPDTGEPDLGPGMGVNLVELAQRLRRLRQERNLTIDDVAARSGLTRSWWSKVENFRITPSLPAMFRVASALGVTVSDLFDGLEDRPELVIVRKSERVRFHRDAEVSSIQYESLAHTRPSRSMDPMMLTLEPGAGRDVALAHEGEEFLIVLEGRVIFEFAERRIELDAGDNLYFDATVKHRLLNPFDQVARVLCVMDFKQSQFFLES